jgi:hypothetical protein
MHRWGEGFPVVGQALRTDEECRDDEETAILTQARGLMQAFLAIDLDVRLSFFSSAEIQGSGSTLELGVGGFSCV